MKDVQKILGAVTLPGFFVILLWAIKVTEEIFHLELSTLGIYPLTFSGLKGILFSPLIHGSYQHLLSNTIPLLILGWALFYFYRQLGITITLLSWLISGIWVWVFARESYHIGASGIIYSWAAFLFVSGLIRRHPRLMALSLLVTFLYGSLVWGIFPLRERVSWEGHLMGMVSGIVLALFFRDKGPQRKFYSWEMEEEDEQEDLQQAPYWMKGTSTQDNNTKNEQEPHKKETNDQPNQNQQVNYIYTPREASPDPGANDKKNHQ